MTINRGKEAYELIKLGAISGLSIGYRTVKDAIDGDLRRLSEIDLYEVSLVTMPSNGLATITGIKDFTSERSFEAFLRGNGFSRWDAKIITSGGYKTWADQRDAEAYEHDADQRDAEAIKSLLVQFIDGTEK